MLLWFSPTTECQDFILRLQKITRCTTLMERKMRSVVNYKKGGADYNEVCWYLYTFISD